MQYAGDHGDKRGLRSYYAAVLVPYLLRKLRLIKQETFTRPAISNLGRLVAGRDLPAGAEIFDWTAHNYLLPTARPNVLARLRRHQEQQHLVVLLSGVFVPCLELIASEIGVAHLVGTRLAVEAGRYLGRIVPPVITGRDKLPMLRRFLVDRGLEVDWQASHAYADSDYDRPVLEAVGHPVAVHPDAGLLALARARGWEIIGSE